MIAHWDEVEGREQRAGDIAGVGQRLGDAAGARGVGLNRIRVSACDRTTAVHVHGASEEIFFVLDGGVYLAYGTREPNDMTWYPAQRRIAIRGLGVSFTVPD